MLLLTTLAPNRLAAQEPPASEPAIPATPAIPTTDGVEPAAVDFAMAGIGLPLQGPRLVDGALDGAHSAMAADFDNDGDLDIVAAARGTASAAGVDAAQGGNLVWYRNLGGLDPAFEPRPIAAVSGAYLAWPADLNRDGHVDIVVAAVTDVNPSAASAQPDAPADATNAPAAPAVPDGAQAIDASGALYWFQNDGQPVPGFVRRTAAEGLAYPVSVRTGDLDGDGDVDLVVPTRDDSRVRWFASSGGPTPTFSARPIAEGVLSAVAVDVGDIDGDGDLDVVSASEDDDRILWYANDGSGGFSPFTVRAGQPEPTMDFAKSVFLADLDGDGDLDIAYASENRNEVGWYRNNGGAPPQWEQRVVAQNRNHVKIVWAADLDNDGDLDLLSASSEDSTYAWYRNDGAQTPSFAPFVISNAASGARFIAAADVDSDGDLDVMGASRDNDQIVWFRNQLVHRKANYPGDAVRLIASYKDARHLRAADLDGDGDADLISVNQSDLFWHENDGAAPPSFTPHQIASTQDRGRWVEPADMDGDGDLDILLAATKNNRIYWYENNGQRPPSFAERTISNAIVGPRVVMAADLDGDGDMDAFAAGDGDPGSTSRIAIYENNGATPPSFSTRIVDDVGGNYARSIYGADIDNDGDIDLLTAEQAGDRIMLYVNNGARPVGFEKRVVLEGHDGEANGAQHVHADDMDGDGDMDVVFGADTGDRVVWVENLDGAGFSWAPRIVDAAVDSVHAVVTADVDADGDADILAAVELSNQVIWYEHDGQKPPNFARHVLMPQAPVAHAVSTIDMEGDGDIDVLAAARDAGFYWLENRGGQYRLVDEGFSLTSGAPNVVSSYVVQHNGRAQDAGIELGSLPVTFVEENGRALAADEITARARSVAIYADTVANGKFDPAGDRLVLQSDIVDQVNGGRITLNLSQHPPAVGTAPGGAYRFFAVTALNSACGALQIARPVLGPAAGVVIDSLAGSALLAEGQTSIGSAPPVTATDPPTHLRVNEIMANPSLGDDWFEIYNAGPFTVDMAGMYVTDDPSDPRKYRIPNGITIRPHGYLVFIADDEAELLHTNFGLKSSGESIAIYDIDARQNRPLDLVTFDAQESGVSAGRIPDGGNSWRGALLAPSPGSANERAGLNLRFHIPVAQRNLGC